MLNVYGVYNMHQRLLFPLSKGNLPQKQLGRNVLKKDLRCSVH